MKNLHFKIDRCKRSVARKSNLKGEELDQAAITYCNAASKRHKIIHRYELLNSSFYVHNKLNNDIIPAEFYANIIEDLIIGIILETPIITTILHYENTIIDITLDDAKLIVADYKAKKLIIYNKTATIPDQPDWIDPTNS